MMTKDAAICIRTIDYSETSQVVTLLTRTSGKITAMAKGSKRRKSAFDGPIEMFATGRVVFSQSQSAKMATLTEFQQQPLFLQLNRRFINLNAALLAAELTNRLTEDADPHPALFDAMMVFLQHIQAAEENSTAIAYLISFELALLRHIGLAPVLDSCINCKTILAKMHSPFYFSFASHGLLCRDCEQHFPDRLELSRRLTEFLNDAHKRIEANEKTTNQAHSILIRYFTELLGKPPKTAKFFSK